MHRHGYQGRKFGREKDQRRALLKSLSEALILHESIETTLPKAKELVKYIEKLITKAKKGDLHSRRQIISSVQTLTTAHKLVDEIAPRLQSRSSGHVRIEKTSARRGDNAQLARVSFIFDEAKQTKKAATTAEKPAAKTAKVKKEEVKV